MDTEGKPKLAVSAREFTLRDLDEPRRKVLRFVDLFVGLGGFHLAMSRFGFDCVLASEARERAR